MPSASAAAPPASPLLEVEDASIEFSGVRALDDVTLTVPEGGVTALIGPNGAGKTTLFNLVTGLNRGRGAIRFAGEDITGLPPHRRTARGLARTFQTPTLIDGLSVFDNCLLGGYSGGHAGAVVGMLRPPRFVLAQNPDAKIGTLEVNNDLSKSLVAGVEEGLGDKADQLIEQPTYEPSATDLSGQVNQLKAAGVDTIIAGMAGPVAGSAIKYIEQIGWEPTIFNYSNAASKVSFADLAGPGAEGVYTVQWLKDPADPQWADEPAMREYREAVEQYGDGADPDDLSVLNGYAFGRAFIEALSTMNDPTREGLIEAWDGIENVEVGALIPEVSLTAGPDGRLVHAYRVARYDGESWQLEGEVINAVEEGLVR